MLSQMPPSGFEPESQARKARMIGRTTLQGLLMMGPRGLSHCCFEPRTAGCLECARTPPYKTSALDQAELWAHQVLRNRKPFIKLLTNSFVYTLDSFLPGASQLSA